MLALCCIVMLAIMASAANLELRGTDSSIMFGDAQLRVACGGDTNMTHYKMLNATTVPVTSGDPIRAHLVNVAHSCAGVAAATPCVPDQPDSHPKVWHCFWWGWKKEYSDGIGTDPVFVDPDLSVSVYEGTSVVRGVGAFIDCPPPTVEFVMKFIGTEEMPWRPAARE